MRVKEQTEIQEKAWDSSVEGEVVGQHRPWQAELGRGE